MSHLEVILLITAYFSMAKAMIEFTLAFRQFIADLSRRS